MVSHATFVHEAILRPMAFKLTHALDQIPLIVVSPYRKYCPAGCRAVAGDVSGDVSQGYRHVSPAALLTPAHYQKVSESDMGFPQT